MDGWSRRRVLQALGLGAATPTLAPLLTACGGRAARARQPTAAPGGIEELRAELRAHVVELSREYRDVTALAQVHRRGGAAADGHERGADVHRETALVFGVTSAGERFEQATTDVSSTGINQAISLLRNRVAPDVRAQEVDLGAAVDHAIPLARDPASQPPREWLRLIDELHHRSQRVGGSRIVYRGAFVTIDDATTLFLGAGRDLSQRVVRTRAGVLLVAWTGSAPSADQAGRAGTLGLEALDVSLEALDAAADRALALLTARPAPEGPQAVVLAPEVTAMVVAEGLAPLLSATAWKTRASPLAAGAIVGASGLTVVDDPTLAGGYGSYFFDDEGTTGAPLTLVEGGTVSAAYRDRFGAAALRVTPSGHGRRSSPLAPLVASPSNLLLRPGATSHDDLLARVGDGVLVEGPLAVRVDPHGGRVVLRCARARGIAGGKLSGALYGAVELRASLSDLLGQAVLGDRAGDYRPHPTSGVPTSAAGPHLATRAEVRRG